MEKCDEANSDSTTLGRKRHVKSASHSLLKGIILILISIILKDLLVIKGFEV